MQIVYTDQANVIKLPLVAKASGNPIVAGTVNFYLQATNGDNAGKWYRGSDQTWQAAESIAGDSALTGDGHWGLSLATAVWTKDVQYFAYAKESGDLHIPVSKDILCKSALTKVLAAWSLGLARDKVGFPGVQEILDPDDGVTVIAEVTMSKTTPYRQVTVL
ncbi:MAG TPA: hypothetical protein VMY06_14925 [Sedimentisphaerales bacterium]|nr:hypothetical protein [Sedimentisphaerales bacterium]HUU15566.1 hypothetical protein [Sedimentisphaerales bacterium]